MKKLMLVMLLGLSSTVALQATERSAQGLPSAQGLQPEDKDVLRSRVRHQYSRFLGHAKKQDLAKFEEFLQNVFLDKSSVQEQHFGEEESPLSRESSVVLKGASKQERELSQPGRGEMTPAQLKSFTKAQALVRGVAARHKMGNEIQIRANMKQMDLLREMVDSYAQEGNHAMIDTCLKLFSGLNLGKIGLRHGEMGLGLQGDREAAESPWREVRPTIKKGN